MSTPYEKATVKVVGGQRVLVPNPAWEIGMLLTRHAIAPAPCAVVLDLRRTAHRHSTADDRLASARATTCTCGSAERAAPPDYGRGVRR